MENNTETESTNPQKISINNELITENRHITITTNSRTIR